ncbi:hypothetical protein [Corynebacterium propinquum]
MNIHKRALAASVLSVSLVAPVVSPHAQASEPYLNVTDAQKAGGLGSLSMPGGEAEGELTYGVTVNPVKVGDTKVTGTVVMKKEEKDLTISAVFFPRLLTASMTVDKSQFEVAEEVPFELAVPDSLVLEAGQQITVGVHGQPDRKKNVYVQVAGADLGAGPNPDQQNPEQSAPEKPAPDTPAPENPQPDQSAPEQQNPDNPAPGNPGSEKKPEDKTPEHKTPEQKNPEPQAPGKPLPDKKPEDKTPEQKKPDDQKKPNPKNPGGQKNPELDKDGLQGSSNIGDVFTTLAAIGGVVGLIGGIFKLFTQTSHAPDLLQPLRGFLSQFNIRF